MYYIRSPRASVRGECFFTLSTPHTHVRLWAESTELWNHHLPSTKTTKRAEKISSVSTTNMCGVNCCRALHDVVQTRVDHREHSAVALGTLSDQATELLYTLCIHVLEVLREGEGEGVRERGEGEGERERGRGRG